MQQIFALKIRRVLLGLFLFLTLFFWFIGFAENRQGILTVAFLDVGQGDAIFIDSPGGKQILIDSGSNKKVLRELSRIIPFYDRSLDILIASHPDVDHIGGFPAIFDAYEVGAFYDSGVLCETALCEILEEKIIQEGAVDEVLTRGQIIDLGDGVFLEILFPDRDASGFEKNMASLVIKLSYGEKTFLFTGDAPVVVEDYLVSLEGASVGGALDIDVLKAGHHGSKTSTSEYFVGATSPEAVVISVGEGNRYGHPHQEVLNILENFALDILRTDEKGTIIIKSDGKKLFY